MGGSRPCAARSSRSRFPDGLPAINEALRLAVRRADDHPRGRPSCRSHTVRAIAMAPTEGLARGMAVRADGPADHGAGRSCRARPAVQRPRRAAGRARAADSGVERWPIHRPAPSLAAQRRGVEFLETGIKVIDLLAPLPRGGKAGLIGGAGVGKTVLLQEFIRSVNHDHGGNLGLCRGRRAHPRGERPLARDAGDGRPGQRHPRLRPDERPAGEPLPRGPGCPDHGRVFPRRAEAAK